MNHRFLLFIYNGPTCHASGSIYAFHRGKNMFMWQRKCSKIFLSTLCPPPSVFLQIPQLPQFDMKHGTLKRLTLCLIYKYHFVFCETLKGISSPPPTKKEKEITKLKYALLWKQAPRTAAWGRLELSIKKLNPHVHRDYKHELQRAYVGGVQSLTALSAFFVVVVGGGGQQMFCTHLSINVSLNLLDHAAPLSTLPPPIKNGLHRKVVPNVLHKTTMVRFSDKMGRFLLLKRKWRVFHRQNGVFFLVNTKSRIGRNS